MHLSLRETQVPGGIPSSFLGRTYLNQPAVLADTLIKMSHISLFLTAWLDCYHLTLGSGDAGGFAALSLLDLKV